MLSNLDQLLCKTILRCARSRDPFLSEISFAINQDFKWAFVGIQFKLILFHILHRIWILKLLLGSRRVGCDGMVRYDTAKNSIHKGQI